MYYATFYHEVTPHHGPDKKYLPDHDAPKIIVPICGMDCRHVFDGRKRLTDNIWRIRHVANSLPVSREVIAFTLHRGESILRSHRLPGTRLIAVTPSRQAEINEACRAGRAHLED